MSKESSLQPCVIVVNGTNHQRFPQKYVCAIRIKFPGTRALVNHRDKNVFIVIARTLNRTTHMFCGTEVDRLWRWGRVGVHWSFWYFHPPEMSRIYQFFSTLSCCCCCWGFLLNSRPSLPILFVSEDPFCWRSSTSWMMVVEKEQPDQHAEQSQLTWINKINEYNF